MDRQKCLECGGTLRKYVKGSPRIHRKCWLKIRDKEERCVDFLFCRDRNKQALKKMKVIEPTADEKSVLLDIAGNEVYVPSHFFNGTEQEEENKIIDQIIDVAGNLISPSSSPPLPPSPLSLTRN